MTEEMKTQQWCGEYSRAISSYPLRKWWQLGLWRTDVECLQGSREAGSQYLPVPLFVPHISGLKVHPGQMEEQYRWRVSLDVAHFFPSEISLRIRDSFLEVTGKHEERPDEHGFAARCFTRKYRLPAEADTTKMVSTLSADGILTVEAPVPESSVPASTIIPIKVEMEEEKEKGRDKLPGHGRGPEHPDFPAAEDKGEVLQLEDHSHHGQPGSAANGLQQEEEETFGEPAGESHPSVPADGRSSESLQEEGRGTDASEQPEPEVAEAITQPELSQLGKGPQSEEDQEQEHQEQEDQKQDQKQDQEQEDQKQDQEQEDQKQDQEQEDQKQDQEQDQKQDQKQEDQKQEDQELEDQKQNQKQEDQKQDQEQEHQKQKDQELEGHDLKQESTE